MDSDPRYRPVDELWKTVTIPPITREEAALAAGKLYRQFGKVEDAAVDPAGFKRRALTTSWRKGRERVCWISTKGGSLYKGWPRLVHDCSHQVFRWRHPRFRPHEHGHEHLEYEMAQFVIASGWLAGTLKPVKPAAPSADDRLKEVRERIERWTSKLKRAQTYLRKYQKKERYLMSKVA